MMSSRAASRGGFCAERASAASVMYGSAVTALRVKIAGTKSTTAAVAATALTRMRPLR